MAIFPIMARATTVVLYTEEETEEVGEIGRCVLFNAKKNVNWLRIREVIKYGRKR